MAQVQAEALDSGFPLAHDSYNAISRASNGRIYYVLSSDKLEAAGQMYVYDPKAQLIRHLGDLNAICGEKDKKCIPQGKSHVSFYEFQGKLYFSTHVGFYQLINGMDRLPVECIDGYQLYPGGHLLSFDLLSEKFEDLCTIPEGEGVVSMVMDETRGHIFGITWPTGKFFYFDVQHSQLQMHPSVSCMGEAGTPGADFRSLCRSLLVDPSSGCVYFSTSEGDILVFDPLSPQPRVSILPGVDLRLDYFGQYDFRFPGNMGYNWRQIVWRPTEHVAYGVHGNSGYLFRFDPAKPSLELVERITSAPSKRSGMFDQFSYGYLGLQLGEDGDTLYYLTGGPIYKDGKRIESVKTVAKGAARGLENLHLVTYHIPTLHYRDHGPIFYSDGGWPQYVNSIAVGPAGTVYCLARVSRHQHTVTDLVKITVH